MKWSADDDGILVTVNDIRLDAKPGKDYDWHAWHAAMREPEVYPVPMFWDLITSGHGFTSVFDGKRTKDSFVLSQHVALDVDDADWTMDDLLELPIVKSHAMGVYPTYSHTPEHPRHRIVFRLDNPVRGGYQYRKVLETMHELFYMADPACVDISRLFFGTTTPGDVFLGHTLPLDTVRLWYMQVLAAKQQRVMATRPVSTYNARSLYEEHDLDEDDIFERLRPIDPYAMDYTTWVKLGAAIAHTFGEQAYTRFKAWSDVPGKPELTEAKWRSMSRQHPNGAGPGTIIYILNNLGG